MKLPKMKNREWHNLSILVVLAIIFALFSISINFGEKSEDFFKAYTAFPITEFLFNAAFIWTLGALWLTYRRWKEAENKREEFENIISSISPDALIVVDPDRNITMCNPSIKRMFGYEASEVIKQKTDLIYTRNPSNPNSYPPIYEILESEGFHVGLATGKKKNGDTMPLEIISGNLSGRAGAVLLVRDITERERTQNELIAAKAKLQHLLTFSPAVIYSCDPGGDYPFTFISENVRTLFGYDVQEFLENPRFWIERIHPEDVSGILAILSRLLDKERHTFEYRFQHNDGTYRWMHNELQLVRDSDGKPLEIIGYWADITEHKQMEEGLLRIQKLESVGILAGGIAHDFNNLLTGVLGNIALAKMNQELKPEVFQILNESENAALQAKGLTEQLLTFSRGGAPVKKTASIAKLVQETTTFTLRGSNISCEFFITEDLWPVEVDEGQMTQVINNLVINAHDAMPEGGTLKLRAINMIVGTGSRLPLKAGRYIQIAIEDQGIGIPKEHLPKIFDPYFSAKEKGRGLGLTVTYSIIKNHNGYIDVESQPGVGTAFYLYLPASEKPSVDGPKENTEGPHRGTGRILVMDDEEVVRNVAEQIITHIGYEVELAREGAEAIELYQRAKESGKPFDAVILDLTIRGGMGGKETFEKLFQIDPDVKGIICSGYSDDRVMAEFREIGFSGVISKPFSVAALSKALHDIITNS